MSTAATPLDSRLRIALRWRDMDMLGHLNQAVYHELLEEGRGAIIAAAGAHFAFVLARVELDYRHEVRRSDEWIEVVTRIDEVGTKKVVLGHDIELPDGRIAASGRSVLVAWDPQARSSRTLTGDERVALGAGEP
jgi:acyl-CoA thioester hydrolase